MKCTAFPPALFMVLHISVLGGGGHFNSLAAKKNLNFLSSVQSSKLLSGRRCREGGRERNHDFLFQGITQLCK